MTLRTRAGGQNVSENKSRRKFLQDATKSLGLLGISPMMSNFIIQTLASEALAANSSFTDRIYIFFALAGGPPRWMFDLPLTPNGTATRFTDHFRHPGLGTFVGMQSSNDPQAIYKPWYDSTTKLWLPPVWGSKPDGGSFRNCLSNALFVRGLDLEINNHELGRLRNQSPIIGGNSIAGLLAEKTGTSFPAAVSGSISKAFKGQQILAPVTLDYAVTASNNPVARATRYFAGRGPANDEGVNQVLAEFDKYAADHDFIQPSLADSKEKADALIREGVTVFRDLWAATYAKYVEKVSNALLGSNTGLFVDNKTIKLPAATASGPDKRIRRADGVYLGALSDLRRMIRENTSVANLASTFATIEILLTKNLTQVITTDLGQLTGVSSDDAGTTFTLTNDQHFIGSLISTLGTTYYYRAILNCTEELIGVLKAEGLFNKTVIQFGAEFSRNAKVDGSGSDHGFLGSSALIMSGLISKTSVIGNITNDTASTYAGTWGLAAPHPIAQGRYAIRINDVARTVCGLLNIPHVANNGEFLLENKGSYWAPFTGRKGEAKNV